MSLVFDLLLQGTPTPRREVPFLLDVRTGLSTFLFSSSELASSTLMHVSVAFNPFLWAHATLFQASITFSFKAQMFFKLHFKASWFCLVFFSLPPLHLRGWTSPSDSNLPLIFSWHFCSSTDIDVPSATTFSCVCLCVGFTGTRHTYLAVSARAPTASHNSTGPYSSNLFFLPKPLDVHLYCLPSLKLASLMMLLYFFVYFGLFFVCLRTHVKTWFHVNLTMLLEEEGDWSLIFHLNRPPSWGKKGQVFCTANSKADKQTAHQLILLLTLKTSNDADSPTCSRRDRRTWRWAELSNSNY